MELPRHKRKSVRTKDGSLPPMTEPMRKNMVQDWQAEMNGRPPFKEPDWDEYDKRILNEKFEWYRKFLKEQPAPGPIKDFKGGVYKSLDDYIMKRR
jgi:hypothetical protein